MKVDLVGPRSRGLAVGLNEFAGYLAVGIAAFLTGYLAARYGVEVADFGTLRGGPDFLGQHFLVGKAGNIRRRERKLCWQRNCYP
jgi:hypothetical protein